MKYNFKDLKELKAALWFFYNAEPEKKVILGEAFPYIWETYITITLIGDRMSIPSDAYGFSKWVEDGITKLAMERIEELKNTQISGGEDTSVADEVYDKVRKKRK
jgi:hypothetical protein